MPDTSHDDIDDPTLYRRAVGYDYDSVQSVVVNGKTIDVPIIVHVPPR